MWSSIFLLTLLVDKRGASVLFLSLAHGIRTEAGHDVIYHRSVSDALSSLGISCKVLVADHCSISPLPENWETALLPGAGYKQLLSDPRFVAPQRIFFLETFDVWQLFDFSRAFAQTSGACDRAWIFLRYDFSQYKLRGWVHAGILRRLARRLNHRLTLLTDSALIQKEASLSLGVPVHLVPIPHTSFSLPPCKVDEGKLRCWWPGPPREAKGQKEIANILQLPVFEERRIEVITSSAASFSSTQDILEDVAPILSREEYEHQLSIANVLLLPYHAPTYRCSTSGIFVEGICAGKMPVVKKGTWLAHELRRFGLSDLIIDWERSDFWSHLMGLYEDSALQAKLALMRANYMCYHSLSHFKTVLSSYLS